MSINPADKPQTMPPITVGVGEMAVSRDRGQVLQTLALGSCLALAAFHPKSGVAGLAHYVLPDSSVVSTRSSHLDAYYVDTGVPALFDQCRQLGAWGGPREFVIKVAGAARMLNLSRSFDVGAHNVEALKHHLGLYGFRVAAASVGGGKSRNLSIEAGTGRVRLWAASRGDRNM